MLALGHRAVRQTMLEVVHLGLHVQQRLECGGRLLEHRASRVIQTVLRQIADRECRTVSARRLVGLLEASHHLEQRRLARTIRSASPTRSRSEICQVTLSSRCGRRMTW